MAKSLRFLWQFPRNLAIVFIGLYQTTLSPDHGPLRHLYPYGYCRHEPTCSEYAKHVVHDRGFVIGSLLSIKRILSCHPWRKLDEKKIRKLLEQ